MRHLASTLRLIHKDKTIWFLPVALGIFILLRIPSLVEPDWYGDEGVYQVVGMAIRTGRLLYRQIWDNKPPFLYLIYAAANADLFTVKVFSMLAGIASIIALYVLAKKLFRSPVSIMVSVGFFSVLFGLPLLEGNIANAENFMLFPVILAAILIVLARHKEGKRALFFLSGILLSVAFLLKVVAVFDFLAFFLAIGIGRETGSFSPLSVPHKILPFKLRDFKKRPAPEMLLIAGFLGPIVLSFVFFWVRGALGDYTRAVFSQNVGYVGYGNYFFFPMGLLLVKSILLFIVIFTVGAIRKKLAFPGVFLYTWLSFSVFNALFSERVYTHYLLVVLPSFCLLIGFIAEKREALRLNALAGIVTLFIVYVAFVRFGGLYAKTFSYYANYIAFMTGRKTLVSYQTFFDKNTPRDYDIAVFIALNTGKNESVFLWSDSPQIYVLSNKIPPGRFIVAYHITLYKNALSETKEALAVSKPKYIIATKNTKDIDTIMNAFQLKAKLRDATIYGRQI